VLTNSDLIELTDFRHELHRFPEVSGEEAGTARRIVDALTELDPTRLITGLGGYGVAAVFDSGVAGPTVMFRAELDGLPIEEISQIPWVSQVPGKGHLCGHDGHMTMLMALARLLARKPVASGRVILLFQPAEEDGSGARSVVADPAFQEICPNWAFAIHNEPGRPFGYVATRTGLINCASQGLEIKLKGKTTHAATPEDGVSPAPAIADLVPALRELGPGGVLTKDFKQVTVTHIRMGEAAFGIAPGDAEIYATLRTASDDALQDLSVRARQMSEEVAGRSGLKASFRVHDEFAASINDPDAVQVARSAMDAIGIPHGEEGLPMRASEDFGIFGSGVRAAMLCLGPGEDYAALHNPDYDFPDALIPVGVAIFERITRDLLGTSD
jgi:amidohydrolase